MSFESRELPAGWQVWNDERDGRAILAFRPDVFDGGELPAECMPTIYLANGPRTRRPGPSHRPSDEWHVTLYLEPEIEASSEVFDDRAAAVDGALAAADRFVAGEVDYRELYQVPREDYFAELDRVLENPPDDDG